MTQTMNIITGIGAGVLLGCIFHLCRGKWFCRWGLMFVGALLILSAFWNRVHGIEGMYFRYSNWVMLILGIIDILANLKPRKQTVPPPPESDVHVSYNVEV